MTTKQTSVNVDIEILDFCKSNKINLSQWINESFKDKFLSLNSKFRRIDEIDVEKKKLLIQIADDKARLKDIKNKLNIREIRYIKSVPVRLKRGANVPAIRRKFNVDFDRSFSVDEFISLVREYSKDIYKN